MFKELPVYGNTRGRPRASSQGPRQDGVSATADRAGSGTSGLTGGSRDALLSREPGYEGMEGQQVGAHGGTTVQGTWRRGGDAPRRHSPGSADTWR